MIYRDAYSSEDQENTPSNRGSDPCLNCGRIWHYHSGWSCRLVDNLADSRFSARLEKERYLTQAMKDSLPVGPVWIASVKCPTLQDQLTIATQPVEGWRAWRNDRPGECACGIVRSMCDYHRSPSETQ